MLDLEVEVSTEVHQRILDKTLRKLNVGPFEEGGSVFLCRVRSIDLSGEYPIIVMIPSPN